MFVRPGLIGITFVKILLSEASTSKKSYWGIPDITNRTMPDNKGF